METKDVNIGVRISKNALNFKDKILSVPFYLIEELPRLLTIFTE